MRTYEKVFSSAYVLVLLLCIVLKVESWPFSNWQVYSSTKRPSDILFFQVSIFDEKNNPHEPLLGTSFGLKVDADFKNFYYQDDQAKFLEHCLIVFKYLKSTETFERMQISRITVDDNMTIMKKPMCIRSSLDQNTDSEFFKDWY